MLINSGLAAAPREGGEEQLELQREHRAAPVFGSEPWEGGKGGGGGMQDGGQEQGMGCKANQ